MDLNTHIGHRLRESRKRAHLTLEQLSRALGVTYQQVQKYETGQSKIPTEKLYECSKIMNIPIQDFFNSYNTNQNTVETSESEPRIITPSSRPPNLLLAECNPVDEFITRTLLEELNPEMQIICIHSHQQFINMIKNYSLDTLFVKPDLIFVELAIAKAENYAVLMDLKHSKFFQSLPIIVFSPSIYAEDLLKIYHHGASSFIYKSFNSEEAKKVLASCLQYWGKVALLPSAAQPPK